MTGEQRGRNQQGEPDQLDTPAFFLAHPHPTRNDRKAVCSQFLFHVSDSSVVVACFMIALSLRL